MSAYISVLVLLAGAFVAFQYTISPLLVWRQNCLPSRYSFKSLNITAIVEAITCKAVPPIEQLEALGFYPVAASQLSSLDSSIHFIVFRSQSETCFASVAMSDNSFTAATAIEFSQLYQDGECLSLTSSTSPPVFPIWDKKPVYRLPGSSNVMDMYKRFRILRLQFMPSRPLIVPTGNELAAIEELSNAELQHLCEIGFVSEKSTGDGRRFTIRGAYLVSWKLLWPWKYIILRRARQRTMDSTEA